MSFPKLLELEHLATLLAVLLTKVCGCYKIDTSCNFMNINNGS